MQKQNINWFATVLRVVICFIILTDLTELFVESCVDEVIKDRGGLDMRRRRGNLSSLGMPNAPQVNIQRRLKRLSLGMSRKASHLSSTSIGMFSSSFCSCDMCESWSVFCVYFSFFFYAPCCYEIVHGWFIEWSLHFTYIFWVWLYRMLHVLHLYHLKFGLPVSLQIENRHL